MNLRPAGLALALSCALASTSVAAAPESKVVISDGAAATYALRVETELRENILPFWMKHARDRERGGFHGTIDGGLRISREAPRGALLTARILWTFSAAYRRYQDPAYLEMAKWAYDDLWARFWDKEQGGLYWRTTADGRPQDDRKVIYVQAFGLYGLSEYVRATSDPQARAKALEIYQLIERHAHDREHRGYFEEFSREWRISRKRGMRRSAMGSLDQKSQNVHLHLLEAYTNLARIWPEPEVAGNLRELIDVMQTRILDKSTNHLRLFLAEDWSPRSDTISFGHDIEYSWLLVEAAEVLGDPEILRQAKETAVRIAAVTLREGVDPDGGVLAEANPNGVTGTFKEWWPQAEAAVGFLNAFQISGDPAFYRASAGSWDFIESHLVDRVNGEWLHGVSRDGNRKSTLKVGFWKCPYHNGRSCLELIDRLKAVTPPQ